MANLDLSQFKLAPEKTASPAKATPGGLDLNSFKLSTEKKPYPNVPTERPNLANLQSEAAASEAESKKINSFTGQAKEFGKAFVKNIASSEVGLGESAGQAFAAPGVIDAMSQADQIHSDTKLRLVKQIRANRAEGKDTTRLEQAYNSLVNTNEPKIEDIVPAIKKSNKQVIGEAAGTLLDVATAGTYGNAAKGAKSFSLLKSADVAAPTAVKAIREAKPAGLFTKTAAKRIATSGITSYGYDLVQNAKDDKKGASLFMPGFGTAIGVAVPTIAATGETIKRGYKIYSGKIDDSMREEAVQGLQDDWQKFFDQKKSTKKLSAKNIAQGKDPAELLAKGGYVPKIVNDKIETGHIIDTTTDQISERMDAVDTYLGKYKDKSYSLSNLEKQAKDILNKDPNVGADLIKSENEIGSFFQSYKKKYGESVNPEILNLMRKEMNKKTRSYKTDAFIIDSADAVGKATRHAIDEIVDSPIVREVNAEIGQIGTARAVAEAVNGDAAKAGKIGRWFARVIGSTIGSSLASEGQSPARGAVQGLLGSVGGDQFVNYLQQTSFTNPNRTKILKTITEDRTLIDKLLESTSEANKAYLERELQKARQIVPVGKVQDNAPIYVTPSGSASKIKQEAFDSVSAQNAPKTRYSGPVGATDVPQVTKSPMRYSERIEPVSSPVVNAIDRHVKSGEQILNDKDVGASLVEVIDDTKKNIIDDLSNEKSGVGAGKYKGIVGTIKKLKASSFKSLEEFGAKVKEMMKDQGGYIATQARDDVGRFKTTKIHSEDAAQAKDFIDYFDGFWGKNSAGKSTLSPEAEQNLIQDAFRIAEHYGGEAGKKIKTHKALANFLEKLIKEPKMNKGSILNSPLGVGAAVTGAAAAASKVYRYSKEKE